MTIAPDGGDIRGRLVELAVWVLDLCDDVARTPGGTHVTGQSTLVNCGFIIDNRCVPGTRKWNHSRTHRECELQL